MSELKKYVVTSDECNQIVVFLTEREATIIKNFLEWGEIESQFCIEPIEDCKAVDWGFN